AVPVLPVDLDDRGVADRVAVVLDDPEHAVGALGTFCEPFLLEVEVGRIAHRDVPRPLHVLEPGDHRLRVFGPGRSKQNQLALDHRPIHGRKVCWRRWVTAYDPFGISTTSTRRSAVSARSSSRRLRMRAALRS